MRLVLGSLVALALLLSLVVSRSSDYPQATSIYTVSKTTSFSVTNQLSQFATNDIEFALYHTFQVVVTSSDTNTVATVALDRGLDGINWTVVGTNANAALSSSGGGEQTMTGKWKWARLRVYGSNVVATVNYLGGR